VHCQVAFGIWDLEWYKVVPISDSTEYLLMFNRLLITTTKLMFCKTTKISWYSEVLQSLRPLVFSVVQNWRIFKGQNSKRFRSCFFSKLIIRPVKMTGQNAIYSIDSLSSCQKNAAASITIKWFLPKIKFPIKKGIKFPPICYFFEENELILDHAIILTWNDLLQVKADLTYHRFERFEIRRQSIKMYLSDKK